MPARCRTPTARRAKPAALHATPTRTDQLTPAASATGEVRFPPRPPVARTGVQTTASTSIAERGITAVGTDSEPTGRRSPGSMYGRNRRDQIIHPWNGAAASSPIDILNAGRPSTVTRGWRSRDTMQRVPQSSPLHHSPDGAQTGEPAGRMASGGSIRALH